MRTIIIATIAIATTLVTSTEAHAHELELGFGYPHGVEVGLGLGNERLTFTLGIGGSGALFEDQSGDPSFRAAAVWVPLGLKAYLTEPEVGGIAPTLRARLLTGAAGLSDAFASRRGLILGGLATVGAAYLPTRAISVGIEAGGFWEVVRWREDEGPAWRDRYFGVVARVTLAIRFGVDPEEATLDGPTDPE